MPPVECAVPNSLLASDNAAFSKLAGMLEYLILTLKRYQDRVQSPLGGTRHASAVCNVKYGLVTGWQAQHTVHNTQYTKAPTHWITTVYGSNLQYSCDVPHQHVCSSDRWKQSSTRGCCCSGKRTVYLAWMAKPHCDLQL